MARYLSPEWFDELNTAARASGDLRAATATTHLTLQQVVTGGPDGDVRYWVRVDRGKVEVGPGDIGAPDITVTQSYRTAVAVITGRVTVQAALMEGRVRLSGNITAIIEHQDALHDVDAAFAAVRAGTSYGQG